MRANVSPSLPSDSVKVETAAFIAELKRETFCYIAEEAKAPFIANATYNLARAMGCKIPAYRKDNITDIDRMFNQHPTNRSLAESILFYLQNIKGGSWGCLSKLFGDDNGKQNYTDHLTRAIRKFCPDLVGPPVAASSVATAPLAAAPLSASGTIQQTQMDRLIRELENIRSELANYKSQLADYKSQLAICRVELDKAKEKNARLTKRIQMNDIVSSSEASTNKAANVQPKPDIQDCPNDNPPEVRRASNPCPA